MLTLKTNDCNSYFRIKLQQQKKDENSTPDTFLHRRIEVFTPVSVFVAPVCHFDEFIGEITHERRFLPCCENLRKEHKNVSKRNENQKRAADFPIGINRCSFTVCYIGVRLITPLNPRYANHNMKFSFMSNFSFDKIYDAKYL